jgi:GMP synthase (glutamine-hydrolysing)
MRAAGVLWSSPPRFEVRRVPQTVALRHVAFEDLGLLAPLLAKRGHEVRYVDVPVADLDDLDPLAADLLVVLGGPIGVYENDLYPFLEVETALLARRLAARRPTLGICLGSQLMAKALGARVYPSGVKEIGWAPLTLTAEGRESPLRQLESMPVLHWHGDTFDLPEGAVRLASTAVCKNQAFRLGASALALQFHAEAAGRALEAWFVGHTGEIAATPGISVPQLRADTARCTPAMERAGAACFEEWLAAAGL